jgi:hypothetical protein
MCLNGITGDVTEKQRVAEFVDWILNINNGTNTSAKDDPIM